MYYSINPALFQVVMIYFDFCLLSLPLRRFYAFMLRIFQKIVAKRFALCYTNFDCIKDFR